MYDKAEGQDRNAMSVVLVNEMQWTYALRYEIR